MTNIKPQPQSENAAPVVVSQTPSARLTASVRNDTAEVLSPDQTYRINYTATQEYYASLTQTSFEERMQANSKNEQAWEAAGYNITEEESGETDVGGYPISGSIFAERDGVRLLIGAWGPTSRENFIIPLSALITEQA